MSLKLYFHPLASFCWKALIPLYENDTPFEPVVVDLMNADSRAAFAAIWPPAKFPVLRDEARDSVVAEATAIIEYLDAFHPGRTRFIPADGDRAWQARMWDRVFDHYVHEPMQKIVGDRLRPEAAGDAFGVDQAKDQIRGAYDLLEPRLGSGAWAMGEAFSIVDCAAAPALFYAKLVVPFGDEHGNLAAYHDRLIERPSIARVLKEAEPFFQMVPIENKPKIEKASVGSAGR